MFHELVQRGEGLLFMVGERVAGVLVGVVVRVGMVVLRVEMMVVVMQGENHRGLRTFVKQYGDG